MAITIAYRGRLADLTRVEDFEDRLLDLALELGAQAQIWRSYAGHQPQRMVRGILLTLAPGQEPASLLLSPEGWLIDPADIEAAERGRLAGPTWCSTQTQFGSLEGHMTLVEMLAVLERMFLTDLEVSDQGGYWDTRDVDELVRRRALPQAATDDAVQRPQPHGLSREAAESSANLLRRAERIAALVKRILERPAEHPPPMFPDDATVGPDPQATEALWDEMFKHNRRQQERLHRAIEDRMAGGEKADEAFEQELNDLALEIPSEDARPEDEGWCDQEISFLEKTEWADGNDGDEVNGPLETDPRHPLLERVMDLHKRLHDLFDDAAPQFAPALRTLFDGTGDMMGGLAQAMSARGEDRDDWGLAITQLKRALGGARFARGSLLLLQKALTAEQFVQLRDTVAGLEQEICDELGRRRSEYWLGGA
jgi:hypothetical protein